MPLAFDISFNIPRELYPSKYHGFYSYVILEEQVIDDHRRPPNFREAYLRGLSNIEENSGSKPRSTFMNALKQHEAFSLLEYCLRTITCCEADFPGIPTESGEYDVGSILRRLSGLSLPSFREQDARLPEILGHTREAQLYALSVFAFVNFHAHLDSDAAFPCSLYAFKGNDTIYHAAFAANSCVEHDFIPPIAIRIASWLATSKARFGIDVRKEELYDQLQPLWKAHDEYLARLQEQEALRLAKISGAPHLYRCANDGCGIRATNKAALKQCGGSCPPERKPRYCTAHCQRAHWPIHREFCREVDPDGYVGVVDDDGHPDWVDVEDFRLPAATPDRGFWRDGRVWAEDEGPEIFIDISNDSRYRQGEVVRIRTKTLSPEFLKAYGRLWTAPMSQAIRGPLSCNTSSVDDTKVWGLIAFSERKAAASD